MEENIQISVVSSVFLAENSMENLVFETRKVMIEIEVS